LVEEVDLEQGTRRFGDGDFSNEGLARGADLGMRAGEKELETVRACDANLVTGIK